MHILPPLETVKDIAATLAEDGERIETNPERLQKVDDRLNTLYSLCQKHRAADEGELIALRDRYAAQLDAITHSDEELAARRAAYVQPAPNITTGWLGRYARMVTSADEGAVLR